ncbi:hypothetical protein IAT38_001631 [Cryptococcus sp. DSM 104549]
MAPVTLPPSFYNSFWSPDYRSGLEVLFKNLEQGLLENDDVTVFIESQVRAHHTLASSLLNPPLSSTSPESSSSLQHTLLSLRGASSARGEAHRALALELEQRVLEGWKAWVERHAVRVKEAKSDMLGKSGVVNAWEKDVQKLGSLKQTYLAKSRAADDSEDDAKFAPVAVRSPPPDNYTSSPKPVQAKLAQGAHLRRSGTVADRITEKLRAASISSGSAAPVSPAKHRAAISIDGKVLPPPPSPPSGLASPSSPREDRFIPPTDPDGKPIMHGAPPVPEKGSPVPELHAQPILLSGLSLPAQGLKDLLQRFDAYLLTNPAPYSDAPHTPSTRSNAALASRQRSTILGTYEKTFSGEEVVEWLKENIEGFGGDWDRSVDAAGELHKMGHFSRIGVGRGFEPSDDTYFILKISPNEPSSSSGGLPLGLTSPLSPSNASSHLPNLLKQYQSYLPASLANSDEPAHVRLRREATKADEAYKEGVWNAEEKRLEMEERIERGLRVWEKWERERLAAVKTVLKQYEEALEKLPTKLLALQKGTSLSVEAYNPEADIKALIEGNRTGPFRPNPHIYESIESDAPEVNFGINLRRWSGEHGWKSLVNAPSRPKGIPEALEAMLTALSEMYEGISEEERRRAWIYEVPLVETHMLRNAINNPKIPLEDLITIVKKFNVPVAAGTVKLYLLELNPPVLGWEGWEDAKAVYPAVGADQERDMTSAVASVLGRLPGSQIFALDAVIKHFRNLVDSTKSVEPDEVYITKLALSVGRTILRPQVETDLTIGDRTPSLFLADLITHYTALFPALVEKKRKESERIMPVRKRTQLVDQRVSRSSLGSDQDPQHLMELQRAQIQRGASPAPPSAGKRDSAQSAVGKRESIQSARSARSITSPPPSASAPAPALAPASQAAPVQTPKPVPAGSASALGFGPPPDLKMAEPADSDEDEPFVPPGGASQAAPAPAPAIAPTRTSLYDDKPKLPELGAPAEAVAPLSGTATPTPASTAAAATAGGKKEGEQVEGENGVIAEGAAGLKRGVSGEQSRLRGPRGARGPRPAGGRTTSHAASASVSTVGGAGDARPSSPAGSITSPTGSGEGLSRVRSRPQSVVGTASRPTTPGVGGRNYGHGSRGSVSAAIAQFEKKG